MIWNLIPEALGVVLASAKGINLFSDSADFFLFCCFGKIYFAYESLSSRFWVAWGFTTVLIMSSLVSSCSTGSFLSNKSYSSISSSRSFFKGLSALPTISKSLIRASWWFSFSSICIVKSDAGFVANKSSEKTKIFTDFYSDTGISGTTTVHSFTNWFKWLEESALNLLT